MSGRTFRIGLIGANPERGWAKGAHVPAIQAISPFKLQAVATTRHESSKAAASLWGAQAAYTDARELIADPSVDLVVVCVKVPDHYVPVRTAIEAGKPVLCEWPLATNVGEARELAALARESQVKTFIGLQARVAPAIAYARDLIVQGYLGRVLGATAISAASGISDISDAAHAFVADKRWGNSALTIAGGHTLDTLCYLLGEFDEVSAVVKVQHPRMRIVETGEVIEKNSPDHVSISGTLKSGAVVAGYVQAGVARGPVVRFEIRGTDGDLCIAASGSHIIEMSEPVLLGAKGRPGPPPGTWTHFEELPIPAHYRLVPAEVPGGTGFNVAQLYAAIASDLSNGTALVPTFEDALCRHELIGAIERAAETGMRQSLG